MNAVKNYKRRTDALPENLKSFTVEVPGSSANLGPGFDTLALAYKLYCKLHFRILETNDESIPLVTLKGQLVNGLPVDQNNLIFSIISSLWRDEFDSLRRLRICIESDIPLGKGIGSSAAAVTGAVWAAFALSRRSLDNGSILLKATELEGHADNAAASLLGGLVISAGNADSRAIVTQKIRWPEDWATIVCVPGQALSTKKSRSVLPKQYSKRDAVANVQNVALLVAAVQNQDEDAMRAALHDRFHEPYRLALVPELGVIRKHVSDLPVLGCVLSGAGSSVLTIVKQRHKQQVLECLNGWKQRYDAGCGDSQGQSQVLDLSVDQEGLKVIYE